MNKNNIYFIEVSNTDVNEVRIFLFCASNFEEIQEKAIKSIPKEYGLEDLSDEFSSFQDFEAEIAEYNIYLGTFDKIIIKKDEIEIYKQKIRWSNKWSLRIKIERKLETIFYIVPIFDTEDRDFLPSEILLNKSFEKAKEELIRNFNNHYLLDAHISLSDFEQFKEDVLEYKDFLIDNFVKVIIQNNGSISCINLEGNNENKIYFSLNMTNDNKGTTREAIKKTSKKSEYKPRGIKKYFYRLYKLIHNNH